MSEEIERLKRENAKLREQIHWLKKGDVLHVLTDQELADQQRHEREMRASITALDDENAKLRELVVRMRLICVDGKRCTFADRIYINSTMEELRIEVKDD